MKEHGSHFKTWHCIFCQMMTQSERVYYEHRCQDHSQEYYDAVYGVTLVPEYKMEVTEELSEEIVPRNVSRQLLWKQALARLLVWVFRL